VKHFLVNASVVTGLVVFGASAFAQNRDEDPYYQQNRDEGWWRGHLFQRVRDDLDHIQKATPTFSADQYRLVVVKKELDDLQGKMESGRYDEAALDRTISSVERVANDNNISPRDKGLLMDDMRRLREFRDHHDGFR